MDPPTVSRLVERTVVGEGGEGFYIVQSGRRANLLAVGEGVEGSVSADRKL